jgi:hypothetical protein
LAGSPIGICLLSRIVAFYKTIVGSQQIERNMRFAETDTVKHNIANNNNIVTRNTILINLGRKIAPTGGVRIYVSGNTVDAVAQKVRLEMITDKDYQFHFAGNLSDYLYVKLYLAPTLYDRWAAGGYKGNVAGHNPDDHSVVYDPSVPLVLDGITLAQDEILPVDVSFILRDGAGIPFDLTNHVVHFRQLGVVDDNPEKPLHELLGNISFLLNIKADEPEENKPASTLQITTPQSNAYCKLYPNPFTDIVYIQYLGKEDAWVSTTVTDITGRTVLTIPASLYKPGITTELHTQQLYAGIYFIRLTNSKGQNTVYKMTKIK